MPKSVHLDTRFLAGLTAERKLVVPVYAGAPATLSDGMVWVDSTDASLRYRQNGVTQVVNVGDLNPERVQDIVSDMFVAGNKLTATYNDTNGTLTLDLDALTSGDITDFVTAVRAAITVTDSATLDLTYTGGALSAEVLDSPLLGGNNPAFYRSVDNHVDGTTNHVFTAGDDAKLAGIEDGATKNATDAALRDRGTHTGQQLAATISDFAAAVHALPIDAATLNGATRDQIEAAVTAAIVDAAPGTLDTLNELAAALGDDPNFATTVTNTLAARARFFAADVPAAAFTAGVADAVLTHGLGTRDVIVQVYETATGAEVDFLITRGINDITVRSEAGEIPAGTYRVNLVTAA